MRGVDNFEYLPICDGIGDLGLGLVLVFGWDLEDLRRGVALVVRAVTGREGGVSRRRGGGEGRGGVVDVDVDVDVCSGKSRAPPGGVAELIAAFHLQS